MSRSFVRAALTASLAAEAVFVALVAGAGALLEGDPWKVVKMPAAFLAGPEVVQPSGFALGDVLLGAAVHLLAAVAVGLFFAWLLAARIAVWKAAMLIAAALYVLGFLILPRIFNAWLAPFRLPLAHLALQAAAHVVYGSVLAWAYESLESRRAGREARRGGMA